jgi:WD40 repeat protein
MRVPESGALFTDAAFDYSGSRLVTTVGNGEADVWDSRTGTLLRRLPGTGVAEEALFSTDGSELAVVHFPKLSAKAVAAFATLPPATIDIWDPRSGRHLRTITGPAVTSQITGIESFAPLSIAISPNGHYVALGGADASIEAWDVRAGRQVASLPLDNHWARSVAWSPDGHMLAAGTAADARVWRFPVINPSVFQHADPSTYSLVGGGTLGVLVSFTRDSRILITSGDNALRAFMIAGHQQVFQSALVARGDLSPDGTRFVTSSQGTGIAVFPCDLCGGLNQLLAVARGRLTRDFTPAERATYLTQG